MALVRSRTQAGHRPWQGVCMSNTRDGAEVSCVQREERWSPGPSVWGTGREGAPSPLQPPGQTDMNGWRWGGSAICTPAQEPPATSRYGLHYTKTLKWQGAPLPGSLGPWGWHHGERGGRGPASFSLTGKRGEKEGDPPRASRARAHGGQTAPPASQEVGGMALACPGRLTAGRHQSWSRAASLPAEPEPGGGSTCSSLPGRGKQGS